ncbi:hypothetical protein TNCV_627371 [Trichonephila clavipes]|nr:hypothetical protein TNCV_627371 [Trichonephila clavipes]
MTYLPWSDTLTTGLPQPQRCGRNFEKEYLNDINTEITEVLTLKGKGNLPRHKAVHLKKPVQRWAIQLLYMYISGYVCIYEITLLQHRSTDYYGNWHVYVLGGGFCAILFVAALYQLALQHINFCTIQSIAKLSTGSLKRMPT